MDCLFVGQHIIELSSVDSTNNYLIDLSQNISLLEGTVVIAKEQTAGKGQRNNSWSSEAGKSLCISVLLKPKLDVINSFCLISSSLYPCVKLLIIIPLLLK